ncbi:RNA polymerase factor sigma-32 [Temperatibacter marinus]|uniref:RNA polymerase factor sigma-32 n=1 Tax=Temperatibacter marinus TaxID=1456591 RepID=A0AA52EJ34_9PROT|nr:RNA polymerase factor sigma-32 [Temperatibacter marinus]WND03439.1 RNA polymerase factor sigma-32 [Temperatibacter marinus]
MPDGQLRQPLEGECENSSPRVPPFEVQSAPPKNDGPVDLDRKQIQKAMREKLLEREEEYELAVKWRDHQDKKALDMFIRPYMRLAISIASRFKVYGLPLNDLIQEGNVGLMQAANRFDPDREVRFSTYASWWIKASIQDFILRNWSIVRTGTTAAHKSLFFNFKRVKAQIDGLSEGPLSQGNRQKLAEEMGVRTKDVELMEGRLSGVDRSLNAPIGEGEGFSWQDTLESMDPTPDQTVQHAVDTAKTKAIIQKAMSSLTDREVMIVSERQLSGETVTLASLGGRLGISKERVRQIEAQAMKKLKIRMMSIIGDPYKAGLLGT